MHSLTDTGSCACHGVSFPTVGAAVACAYALRTHGYCHTFRVGRYRDGGFVTVYEEGPGGPAGLRPEEGRGGCGA